MTGQRFWQNLTQTKDAKANNADAHGSSEWMTPEEIRAAGLHDEKLPFVAGRSETGDLLRYGGDGHCLTFAPTGAGKGVSVVLPNLLHYRGSVVCLDPKGAIAAVTADYRRSLGQEVILLDPFGEVERAKRATGRLDDWEPLSPSRYNPFSHLSHSDPLDVVDDVRLIASSLIVQESEKNRYFSDSARMVLEAIILHLLAEDGAVTFDDLFPVAFDTKENFAKTLRDMQQNKAFSGHVAHLSAQIEALTGDAGASIWSTLYRSLNLIKSPRLLPAMQPSSVDFRKLKIERKDDKGMTVYLVLPARHLETHNVWLRLMLSVILAQISDARQSRWPVLFMVDECAALGRLEILETAVGLMRGYGLKLWLIFQDLPQLKAIYGARAGSFISNAGLKQFFNVNDLETSDFVSQYLGQQTRAVMSQNVNSAELAGGGSVGTTGRALLTGDEVRRMKRDEQILFYDGEKPIKSKKLFYYRDAEFKNSAARDPYYQGDKT